MDSISAFKIASMNVNGISSKTKMREMVTYANKKNVAIFALIDTRLSENKQKDFKNQTCNYDLIHTPAKEQARGVSFLIKKSLPISICEIIRDDRDANFLILKGKLYNETLTIGALYGPNLDDPSFIQYVYSTVRNLNSTFEFIIGDYNITINPLLDNQNYLHDNNPRARERLKQIMEQHGYHDSLREQMGDIPLWTWQSYGFPQRARLDMIISSHSSQSAIIDSSILEQPVSDHRGVVITVDFNRISKGPGTYRIPSYLFNIPEYTTRIEAAMREVYKRNYRSAKYKDFFSECTTLEDLELDLMSWYKITNLPMKKNHKTILEEIFLAIKTTSINMHKELRTDNEIIFHKIGEKIAALDKEETFNKEEYDRLNDLIKKKLQDITADRYLHKDAEWAQAGERLSPTICNLEKSKHQQKFFAKLVITDINNHETVTTDQTDIESHLTNFYKDLYSKHEDRIDKNARIIDFIPQNHQRQTISDDTRESLEGLLTVEELARALQDTENKTVPGEDGIPYIFYKKFWEQIKHILLLAANRSLISRKLPTSQRRGLISLIPKGDKDRRKITNWRPICLLNTFYKLVSSALAKRLSKALPEVIDADQTGFLAGRYINENNLLTAQVIEHAKKTGDEGLIVCVDFEKAFDSLDHQFILNALSYFGFGRKFICYIKTMLTGFSATIMHAGKLLDFFELQRGARQGDPLAALLFILCVEILAIRLREDPNISHYQMNHTLIQLVLYADDLNCFIKRDETSLRTVIRILKDFKDLSGLQVQLTKTQIVYLGKDFSDNKRICTDIQLTWNQSFKLLGIEFNADSETQTINYEHKISKIMTEITKWRSHLITPIGRLNLVTGLFLSKVTHIAAVLPALPLSKIRNLELQLYNFIWGGRGKEKMTRGEAKLGSNLGGLNAPDVASSWDGLKIAWLRRIPQQKNTKWYELLKNKILHTVDPRFNLDEIESWSTTTLSKIIRDIDSELWKSIFKAYRKYLVDETKINKQHLLKINSWGSGQYRNINGNKLKVEQLRTLEENNILPVDLIIVRNNNVVVMSPEEILAKWTFVRPAHARNASTAVSKYTQDMNLTPSSSIVIKPTNSYFNEHIFRFRKGSSQWTRVLKFNQNDIDKVKEREEHWRTRLQDPTLDDDFWKDQYSTWNKIQFDNKLKLLQIQILKHNLKTNIIVSKFARDVTVLCSLCQMQRETICHLFYECHVTSDLRRHVNCYLKLWTKNEKIQGLKDCLFFKTNSDFNEREIIKLLLRGFTWQQSRLKTPVNMNLECFKSYMQAVLFAHMKAKTIVELEDKKLCREIGLLVDNIIV